MIPNAWSWRRRRGHQLDVLCRSTALLLRSENSRRRHVGNVRPLAKSGQFVLHDRAAPACTAGHAFALRRVQAGARCLLSVPTALMGAVYARAFGRREVGRWRWRRSRMGECSLALCKCSKHVGAHRLLVLWTCCRTCMAIFRWHVMAHSHVAELPGPCGYHRQVPAFECTPTAAQELFQRLQKKRRLSRSLACKSAHASRYAKILATVSESFKFTTGRHFYHFYISELLGGRTMNK